MSKDFRASQIETSKLIASGGIGSKVGLVIYSGSIAADRSGNVTAPHNTKMLEHVGDKDIRRLALAVQRRQQCRQVEELG